jgi:hypothetical protein
MRTTFITTCSSQKIGGGSSYSDFPSTTLAPSPKLLKIRQEIFRAIRSGRIEGDLRGANEGPDFGGSQSGAYLRAFDRYGAGSFVSALSRELGEATTTWTEDNRLFFVSGLYGLLDSHEPIQNYNVRLEHTGEYWTQGVITRILIDTLGEHKEKTLVLNCCALPLYSEIIGWEQLEASGILVRHVVGYGFEDRQVRSAAASVAANIDSKYESQRVLNGSVINCVDADIRFISTREIRSSKWVDIKSAPQQHIGLIVMEKGDREELLQRFGTGLSRHIGFEFADRSQGEEGLKRLQQAGCVQCLFRILGESHAKMREGFGQDLAIEIRKHGMQPIGFNNFSQLKIDVNIRHSEARKN